MSKPFEEMTFDEQIDYIVGDLVLAIGSASFRSCVSKWTMYLQRIAYDRSVKAGKK